MTLRPNAGLKGGSTGGEATPRQPRCMTWDRRNTLRANRGKKST